MLNGTKAKLSGLLAGMGVIFLLLGCQLLTGLSSGDLSEYGVVRDESIFLAGSQPRTFDPALTYGGPSGPMGHVFSGLVALDADLQVQPDLAAGWIVSEDGLTYTFYLRQNAVFHNGRSVTAADVIYSWERAAAPATGSDTAQTYLGDIAGFAAVLTGEATTISGLRAIDDHTLEVQLTAPIVYFLPKLAYPVAFVLDQENVTQRNWEHEPNGTGPFKLEVWRDDEIMVLARNEYYYRARPQIKHLVLLMGAGIPLSMYETGEIDLVGIGGSTLERVRDPNDPLADELQQGVSMCTTTIGLNNRIAPFDDLRVRQAFNYALDKKLLIELFWNGNALPSLGPLPPGMPGYTGDFAGYPFDPVQGQQLLAEAGYPNGDGLPVLTFYTSGYGDPGDFVTAVITMWQENLGVTIEPVILEPFAYYDELYSGNVGNIYDSGWCADYPDPQNFLDILYHSQSAQNIGGFADSELDQLLEQARIEPDVARRLGMYADIEAKLVTAAPVIFVAHDIDAVLVKPYVENYKLTPIGIPQWHLVSR